MINLVSKPGIIRITWKQIIMIKTIESQTNHNLSHPVAQTFSKTIHGSRAQRE